MSRSHFVTTIDPENRQTIDNLLSSSINCGMKIVNEPFTIFAARGEGIICKVYKSGKVLLQGKSVDKFAAKLFPKTHRNIDDKSYDDDIANEKFLLTSHIGCDESGKGDVFGPLCVAGVFVPKNMVDKAKSLDIKDSKMLNDNTIRLAANNIKENFCHHVLSLFPEDYNAMYNNTLNLNTLLAKCHAQIIDAMTKITGCHIVVVDKFAKDSVLEHVISNNLNNANLQITQNIKGERDIAVAAASIIAREAFLDGIDLLSKKFLTKIPKGASLNVVNFGKEFVKIHGKNKLPTIGKMHFKTIQKIICTP